MSGEVASLISSVSAMLGIAKVVVDARDGNISAAIKAELTEKVLATQSQLSQVLGSIIEKDSAIQVLSQRVRELESQQAEKARYRLAKVGTVGEFFAYELRPATELVERSDEPAHFVCQPCFDAGKKSVMRRSGATIHCSLCKGGAQVEPGTARPQRSVVSNGFARRDF